MRAFRAAILYGFLVWLIPFVISFIIFPLKTSDRPLFESIMPVAVTISTVLFLILSLKNLKTGFLKKGILLGILWYIICSTMDLFLFMYGPMKMTFIDYMKDIGLTYLIIPVITIGSSYLIKKIYQVRT